MRITFSLFTRWRSPTLISAESVSVLAEGTEENILLVYLTHVTLGHRGLPWLDKYLIDQMLLPIKRDIF